jgi:hypothetical protein
VAPGCSPACRPGIADRVGSPLYCALPMRAIYLRVILLEVIVLVALWAFERHYS